MSILLQIIFWIALISILQTYLFYPLLVISLARLNKRKDKLSSSHFTPEVTVLFAAYNEESVIEAKIKSIYNSNYPQEKINVLIGSDASTDATDEIVNRLSDKYENLELIPFTKRTGKSGIINKLYDLSSSDYVIATDANIIFNLDTIPNLIRHFKDESVSLVGGNLDYFNKVNSGISQQENTYLSLENNIKQAESDLWSIVQGVEGGLYAIRKEWFTPIPPLTFMEDFFITYKVLENSGKVLFDRDAKGYEDISVFQEEEFKRKTRISIGNFQNLKRFKGLIIKRPFPLGFAFLSHKVLRWLTPFMAALTVISAFLLKNQNFYSHYLEVLLYLLLLTILDSILYWLKLKSGPLRFLGHFVLMNMALLNGYIKYLKGVRTNVWQPTKRNQ